MKCKRIAKFNKKNEVFLKKLKRFFFNRNFIQIFDNTLYGTSI